MPEKKRCFVVGAGGGGREVISWAAQMHQEEWRIEGFLDSNPDALGASDFPYRVLGDPANWAPSKDEVFAVGLGDPASRLRVCGALRARGARFVSIVHPSAVLAFHVKVGEGCVLTPNVVIGANARLEDFVFANVAACIGHDAHIGEGTTLGPYCTVMGYAEIGRACFIGSHSAILPKKKVGDGAIVGAGSIVVRNVAANTTVMGPPAQLLGAFSTKTSA